MLSIYEIEKVEIAKKLLQEVDAKLNADEVKKSILLGDAINACDEVLQEDLPEGYTPPNKEDWYSPESIENLLPAPTMGDRILEGLSSICRYSLLFSGLIACLSLGNWGAAEIFNSNMRIQSELKSQSRSCLGISTIFLSVAAGSVVLALRVDKKA